jgi:hypothetical protein
MGVAQGLVETIEERIGHCEKEHSLKADDDDDDDDDDEEMNVQERKECASLLKR